MLLKTPEFDEQVFIPGKSKEHPDPVYSLYEIDKLVDYLLIFPETPITSFIIPMLRNTQKFNAATTSDPFFVSLRNKYKTDKELLQTFDQIVEKFKNAKTFLAEQKPKSKEYRFLFSAINYCLESIRENLNKLKKIDDRVYGLYQGSELQTLLETDFFANNESKTRG